MNVGCEKGVVVVMLLCLMVVVVVCWVCMISISSFSSSFTSTPLKTLYSHHHTYLLKKDEKVPNYDNNVICDMHNKRDDFKRKSCCLSSLEKKEEKRSDISPINPFLTALHLTYKVIGLYSSVLQCTFFLYRAGAGDRRCRYYVDFG